MKTEINSASDITLIKQINNTNLYFCSKSGGLQMQHICNLSVYKWSKTQD